MVDLKSFDIATSVTDSLIELFDMMLSLELTLADDQESEAFDGNKIAGSVDLAGRVLGRLVISVSEEFSHFMTAAMLDITIDEAKNEESIKDVISEVCNIVGGNLKSAFCDVGLTCKLSPPSFTTGDDFKIESLNVARYEKFVFSYQEHRVIVEVGVKVGEPADLDDQGVPIEEAPFKPVEIEAVEEFDVHTPITDSITEVFDMMLDMSLKPSDKDLKTTLMESGSRIVGGVSFVGALMGAIHLQFTEPFSRKMTAAMLGIEEEEVESVDEVKDVISEVCNIVGGNLKSKFCDADMMCTLSTPSFTSGSDFMIETQNMVRYERISFLHEDNSVFIELVLKVEEGVEDAGGKTGEKPTTSPPPPAETGDEVISQEAIDALLQAESSKEPPAEAAPAVEPEPQPVEKDAPADTGEPKEGADAAAPAAGEGKALNLDYILDVPTEITIELGHTRRRIDEVLKLGRGAVVPLNKLEGEPVDILVNNTLIARGVVIVEGEKYGIRVTEIVDRTERIESLLGIDGLKK
jgi:flagellar motor switch protein FliN/FliY